MLCNNHMSYSTKFSMKTEYTEYNEYTAYRLQSFERKETQVILYCSLSYCTVSFFTLLACG